MHFSLYSTAPVSVNSMIFFKRCKQHPGKHIVLISSLSCCLLCTLTEITLTQYCMEIALSPTKDQTKQTLIISSLSVSFWLHKIFNCFAFCQWKYVEREFITYFVRHENISVILWLILRAFLLLSGAEHIRENRATS